MVSRRVVEDVLLGFVDSDTGDIDGRVVHGVAQDVYSGSKSAWASGVYLALMSGGTSSPNNCIYATAPANWVLMLVSSEA